MENGAAVYSAESKTASGMVKKALCCCKMRGFLPIIFIDRANASEILKMSVGAGRGTTVSIIFT